MEMLGLTIRECVSTKEGVWIEKYGGEVYDTFALTFKCLNCGGRVYALQCSLSLSETAISIHCSNGNVQ